jgi:hypothetical protein
MPDIHSHPNEEAVMGFEGELLISTIPAVDDVPLSMLAGDEGLTVGGEETDVPVAEFQSSV